MRFIYIVFVIVISNLGIRAQQLPQYTQYMLNDFNINPAVAGAEPYTQIKLNSRIQWAGFEGAPKTYLLSVYGPTGKRAYQKNVGLGGYIYGDYIGSTSRLGAYFSYAYHLTLIDFNNKKLNKLRLSLALSGGFSQYKINNSKIIVYDEDDPFIMYMVPSVVLPDATFGTYLYTNKYNFGISWSQLINNRIRLLDNPYSNKGELNYHYFIMGGYKFFYQKAVEFYPSFIVKKIGNLPLQTDISAKLTFQKTIMIGASYRMQDAFMASVGYLHNEMLFIGYSYDITTSNIKNYSNGTHEIVISYRLNSNKYRAMVN